MGKLPSDLSAAQVWRNEHVQSVKQSIKTELDAVGEAQGIEERLEHALRLARDLEHGGTPDTFLRRYVYAMSALVHHLNHGGLSRAQVKALSELALAILKAQRIQPTTSKLSFLHGDVHLVLSQIFRKDGQEWEALWQQLTSLYASPRGPAESLGHQSFALAHHALRLGFGTTAVRELERAEELGLPPGYEGRVRLERIKALRIVGRVDESQALADDSTGIGFREEEALELQWEALSRAAHGAEDIGPMMTAVLPGKPLHTPYYLAQAFLWSRLVHSRSWLSRFPKLAKLASRARVNRKSCAYLGECASAFDALYDSEIPYDLRLAKLGELLPQVRLLPNIDWEMLVWAASARWLSRNQTHRFTVFVDGQYRQLCLLLTDGGNADTLGQMADISLESPPEAKEARS